MQLCSNTRPGTAFGTTCPEVTGPNGPGAPSYLDVHNVCQDSCADVLPKKPEDQEDHAVEG